MNSKVFVPTRNGPRNPTSFLPPLSAFNTPGFNNATSALNDMLSVVPNTGQGLGYVSEGHSVDSSSYEAMEGSNFSNLRSDTSSILDRNAYEASEPSFVSSYGTINDLSGSTVLSNNSIGTNTIDDMNESFSTPNIMDSQLSAEEAAFNETGMPLEDIGNISIEAGVASGEALEDTLEGPLGAISAANQALSGMIFSSEQGNLLDLASANYAQNETKPGVNSLAEAQQQYSTSVNDANSRATLQTGLSGLMGPLGTLIATALPNPTLSSSSLDYTAQNVVDTSSTDNVVGATSAQANGE